MAISSILRPNGTFCGHLMVIWYVVPTNLAATILGASGGGKKLDLF
jgi:hypothetical protein